ncbi:MAG: transcriptional regulator, partial [Mesorhizobium sp.]
MISSKLVANAESAAAFLTLMGNEKRLLIVSYLIEGEMSVGAIAEKVQLSQSALSQHLAKLRAL